MTILRQSLRACEGQEVSSAGAKRGAPAGAGGGQAEPPPCKLGAREMERKAGPPAAAAAQVVPAQEAPSPEAPAQEAPAEQAASPGERGEEITPGDGEAPQSRLSGGKPPQKAEGPECGSPAAADEDGQEVRAAAQAPPPSPATESGVVLPKNAKPLFEGAPPTQGHLGICGESISEPENEPSCEVPSTAAAGDELLPPAPKAPSEGGTPVE